MAIAIGIVSFVLLAVFSLMASSLRQIQYSEADSRLSSVAQQAYFTAQFELGLDTDFQNPPAPWQGGDRDLYFDKECRALGFTNSPEAYFHARLRSGAAPSQAGNVPANSLKSLTMSIEWPAAAPTNAAINTQTYSLLLRNTGRL